jgi:hypothetical protein
MPKKKRKRAAVEEIEHFPWFNSQQINQHATIVAISLAGYTANSASSVDIRRKALAASVKFNNIHNGREIFDTACLQYPKEFKAMQDKFVHVVRNAFQVHSGISVHIDVNR